MKRITYSALKTTLWAVPGLALLLSSTLGCLRQSEAVNISGDAEASMVASAHVIDEVVSQLHRELALTQATDAGSEQPCDEDELVNCEQIDELLGSHPELRTVFVAEEQLTAAGIVAAELIQNVRSHALDPRDFPIEEIREHVAALAAWQQGRAILEAANVNEAEAGWLQRVARALTPEDPPSRARLVELASGGGEGSLLPRQARELRRYGRELREVADLASQTNRLLLRAVVKYARVQNLDYTYTVPEQELVDRELLYADPEDPQEEEVLGGPARSREWLEPWRMAGIDGAEPIDAEVVGQRERELLRDRIRQFLAELPSGDFARKMAALEPQHEQYQQLRSAFVRYLALAQNGGWNAEPIGQTLEEGDTNDAVIRLRRRLAAEGFLAEATENARFDAELKEALLEFQESSQIPETGKTDSATRDALETRPEERLAVIAHTLQKWREIRSRRDFDAYYIQINIPSYHGEVRDEGELVYRYRVIVGRDSSEWSENSTETPEFSDRLERMVFNPFWHLPTSIIENEVIPALSDEEDYLARHNYEVRKNGSRIFIKQRPGAGNALGRVKFLFPNQFAIYMHDTPTRHLFSRVKRDFSHGCMRVHEPLALAELFIQRDRGWSERQIERFISSALRNDGEDTVMHLDTPVPVHVVYLLSRVDEHGNVEFFGDVYGRQADSLDAARRQVSAWLDVEI